ncbi:kinase-like domain-containing protein [Mycena rebaudengoi]|nr:kinase-like domain-containing protein [Mycena rebaudengoi]
MASHFTSPQTTIKPPVYDGDICAKLVTTNRGRKEAIILKLNKPVTIGRSPRCPNGGVIVSCQDFSRNGIILNSHRINKTVVILMDGDILQIPDSLCFICQHIWIDETIGKYLVTSQTLGSGSFATVHLAMDTSRTTRRQVACKAIHKKKGYDSRQIAKEIMILTELRHPNINRLYDTEQNEQFTFLFLELSTGGDLFTYIMGYSEKQSHLCEAEAKFIMYQLLIGLLYLHSKMISHRGNAYRDWSFGNGSPVLQPENILLHAPGPYPRIVIADFGLARPKAYQETLNVCGTVAYLPPEGILALDQKDLKYVGMPADCWSAGVILYIMLWYA